MQNAFPQLIINEHLKVSRIMQMISFENTLPAEIKNSLIEYWIIGLRRNTLMCGINQWDIVHIIYTVFSTLFPKIIWPGTNNKL